MSLPRWAPGCCWRCAGPPAAARYSRTGFEAAAVTYAYAAAAPSHRPGLLRTAELRFGHPFAVVAVTAQPPSAYGAVTPWQGLPVFSAWITQPENADNPA